MYGHVSRGLPSPTPSSGPRSSGLGNLKGTVKPSEKAKPDGIPPEFSSTIRATEQSGQDAVQGGAENEPAKHPPGSQSGNIPADARRALIPPGSWNVP